MIYTDLLLFCWMKCLACEKPTQNFSAVLFDSSMAHLTNGINTTVATFLEK